MDSTGYHINQPLNIKTQKTIPITQKLFEYYPTNIHKLLHKLYTTYVIYKSIKNNSDFEE